MMLTRGEVRDTFRAAQSLILLRAVAFERELDHVLASALARDDHAYVLLSEALPGLAIRRRIDLLEQILEPRDLCDRFPFLLPVARRLFDTRNFLAHSEPLHFEPDNTEFEGACVLFESYNRGRRRTETIPLRRLAWLTRSSLQVLLELRAVGLRVLSDEQLNEIFPPPPEEDDSSAE